MIRDDADPTEFSDEEPETDWSPLGWVWDSSLWVFITLGFVVFELTSNVALGIAVTCFKFGGPDLLSALWARSDPFQPRGSAVSYFCLARAAFRIGGAALLLCCLIVLADALFRVPIHVDKFIGAMSLVFVGAMLGTAFATVAAVIARSHRVPLWIDEQFHQSRRYGTFPPALLGTSNRVRWVVNLAIVLLTLADVLIVGSVTYQVLFNRGPGLQEVLIAGTVWGVLLTLPAWQLFRFARYIARTPAECWWELLNDEIELIQPQ